jgi:glycosyltransferase involved in cell wall biosynthesis
VEAQASRIRFPGVEVVVIPNGIEIPAEMTHTTRTETIRLLYLGRLHPKKGIENLLDACKRLDHLALSWSLTVAGSGDGCYTKSLLVRINELGLRVSEKTSPRHVAMVGEASPSVKKVLFESADIVVVPSYTENFGMIVAEALAHEVPVIASTGTPWTRLDEKGCGMCVNNDPETLAKAIEQMGRMPLHEMGHRGRNWMEREFSWSDRARDFMELYGTLIRSGPR